MSNDTNSRCRPHPWHGLPVGPDVPRTVHAYIEIAPSDDIKYEVDKDTGFLCVDRPQRTSSRHPTPYGFIPRTYCGERVQALMPKADCGDGDPLDICVISDLPIERTDILMNARVVGGLPMLDDGEADDKIIAVLEKDWVYGEISDVSELPPILIERLAHYFLTYKQVQGKANKVEIGEAYGYEHARKVLEASMADYDENFADRN